MKKTISTWWPLAILLPLALTFFMHAGEGAPSLKHQDSTTVAGVSAELARASSYGLIEGDAKAPATIATPKAF